MLVSSSLYPNFFDIGIVPMLFCYVIALGQRENYDISHIIAITSENLAKESLLGLNFLEK